LNALSPSRVGVARLDNLPRLSTEHPETLCNVTGLESPAGTADGWPLPLRGFYDRMAA